MIRRIVEANDGGFETSLGEKVCIFCGVYIYTGVLVGVNDTSVELDHPAIVYETGDLSSGKWKDAQKLPGRWNVMLAAIESWGPAKC